MPKFALIIILTLGMSSVAYADLIRGKKGFVIGIELEKGDCHLIVGSRKTLEAALEFLNSPLSGVHSPKYDFWTSGVVRDTRDIKVANSRVLDIVRVFLSENGWYAISIGYMQKAYAASTIKYHYLKVKNPRKDGVPRMRFPRDMYCSSGEKYIKAYDRRGNLIEDRTKSQVGAPKVFEKEMRDVDVSKELDSILRKY